MRITNQEKLRGVARIQAEGQGPQVVVFGGVHGDEVSGVLAIEKILFDFVSGTRILRKGTLILARGNEEALAQRTRYVRYNLNRLYRDRYEKNIDSNSYEFRRAQELKTLLKKCDYFLDLHSAPIAQEPFIVTERKSTKIFAQLGIPRIITGWTKFSNSSIGGDGESYAYSHHAIAATLEAGSHFDWNSIDVAYESVLTFLSIVGMVVHGPTRRERRSEIFDMYDVQIKMSEDFHYTNAVKNFQYIRKGEPYAFQDGRPLIAKRSTYLLIPMKPEEIRIGEEVCYLGQKVAA